MFETEFFQRVSFSEDQIRQYLSNAQRDLKIAQLAQEVEVQFTFAYQAFLKLGITLIAREGYKAKSRQGHHVQIILHLARLLKNRDVEVYGEAMRRKRNIDLYSGGTLVTEKEAKAYLIFVETLFNSPSLDPDS